MNELRQISHSEDRLTGTVDRVSYHNDQNGFCVLRLSVRGLRDQVTVVGFVGSVSAGEFIEALGHWRIDPIHGRQFQSRHLVTVAPTTLEGIEKYLGSGMVRGLGPYYAKQLVDAFGLDVFNVIEISPDELSKVKGIGAKRKEKIIAGWTEQKKIREIIVFLHSNGVGTARAVRIYKTYGDAAIALVTENPYRLAFDIRGIGFLSADALAQRLGIPFDSPLRAQAGISHVLSELSNEGHCAASINSVISSGEKLLGLTPELLNLAIDSEIAEGRVIPAELDGVQCLYLAALYYAEIGVAANLSRLASRPVSWREINAPAATQWVEGRSGTTLSSSQRSALSSALSSKIIVITGGPGVGKTTLVNSIVAVLSAKRTKIVLCAPTGRAAKRLSESTGYVAKTIHRLLEFDPATNAFRFNRDHQLDCDLLVLDEASMVDVILMNKLLSAIPDRGALMIVGDVDQLASVGPGKVLADIIDSSAITTVRLTEIFRQASHSMIVQNAHRINSGHMPKFETETDKRDFFFVEATDPEDIQRRLLRIVSNRIPDHFGYDVIQDIQVLTPMNRGGVGARALNDLLQHQLNPHPNATVTRYGLKFSTGDKVLQIVNDYDKDVFNGDIGVISSIDETEGIVLVTFDGAVVRYEYSELDELVLAYATSIHKAQGSEYKAVVIPLSMSHFMMLNRNLIYTAVTRSKELLVIVGEKRALAMAVRNGNIRPRVTGLSERIRNSCR